MNMSGSELNPLLGRMDDEDCFGFHSEYYIKPDWREQGRCTGSDWGEFSGGYPERGYVEYSKYQDDIYFVAKCDPQNHAVYIVKSNVKQKTSCAIKLDIKKSFDHCGSCIAVNRQGYFLYNSKVITLFGFDGREIYTYKFGQKNYVECVYIYDNMVFYSETRQAAMSTQIYCVNMVTQEKGLVWGSQKGNCVFDNHLRESYQQEWGMELPFSGVPSNIGDIDCKFLYANKHRVIAGYTRYQGHRASYIIHVDLTKNEWSILDCFAMPNFFKIPGWKEDEIKAHLPSWDARHIFSFNMLDNTMWVKTSDKDIRLIQTDIQRVAQLKGKYPVDWKLCLSSNYGGSGAKFLYFDGKRAFLPDNITLNRLTRNGEMEKVDYHPYQTRAFWCFGDIYLIPDWNGQSSYNFCNITGGLLYRLLEREKKELFKTAERPQLKAVAESKKEGSSGCVEPVCSDDDDPAILEMARKLVDETIKKAPGRHHSEAEIEMLVQFACEMIRERQNETAPGDEVPSHEEKEAGRGVTNGPQLSLVAFRASAPSMTGFREALLSYRKSLPNNWDYNAFVGILLGVGGPKHGDAACMNFAIGQGDNGNNTKKTLAAKGLMPVFEKYRGKKIDEAILLSDVEDEILTIAPEYAPIRQTLHKTMKG